MGIFDHILSSKILFMVKNKRVALFFFTNVVFNLAANFVHAVTPTFFSNLKLGQYMFGVALAAMLIVNFIFSPFWGKINEYISSRVSLLICCVGYAIGQYFFSSGQTEAEIIIARAVTGFFTAGCFVSILTYIVNTTEDERLKGVYLAASATIQMIGGAFGYFIGGLLGEISVHTAFYTQIITLMLCGIGFFLICKSDAKIPLKGLSLKKIAKESNPLAAFSQARFFMTSFLASIFILCILQALGNTSFDQSFNFYLRDVFKFSSGYNGIIKGATGILSLVVNSTITMYIINKTRIRKSIGILFGFTSLIMLIALLSSNPISFTIANVSMYAFSAACLPVLQTILARYPSGDYGNVVMGFFNSMKSLGSILGALFSGLLYSIDPKFPFLFGFIAYVLATIISFYSHKRFKVDI